MTGSRRTELIPMEKLEMIAPIIRSVAHPLRLRIVDFLDQQGEPRNVTEITEAAGAEQAMVSQQLRILKDQRVLSCKRDGNHVLYAIANPNVLLLLECIDRHCALPTPPL